MNDEPELTADERLTLAAVYVATVTNVSKEKA